MPSTEPRSPLRALFVVGALTVAACAPDFVETGPYSIEMGASPTPAVVGDARILIRVVDSTGAAVGGLTVEVSGVLGSEDDAAARMSAEAVEDAPGRYSADPVAFSEAGDWIVRVLVRAGDGVTGERTFPLHVVDPGG